MSKSPKKPTGFCSWGHDQTKYAFVDSGGDIRCRECRRVKERDREYWKLVTEYMKTQDKTVLEKLEKYHWNEP